jgi:enoyl-CoA hydratase/carnithine racemase
MNEKENPAVAGRIGAEQAEHIATVTIGNPDKRNALTVAMWQALETLFTSFRDDPSVRCVVVRGAGNNFAAGADISEFDQVRSTREQVTDFHELVVSGALRAIYELPVPVIAMIDGACAGGGLEIASVCDLRLASRRARLGIPIRTLGFSLAMGEMEWLYRLAGPALTAELLFEGRMLDAQTALAKGLLTDVVDDARLSERVYAAAGAVARSAPLAVRAHKRQLRRLMNDAAPVTREERLASYGFADTEDYRIGIRAFRAGTPPEFTGR